MRASTQDTTISNDQASAVRPAPRSTDTRRATGIGRTLWIVQGILALVFLFAGGMKLVMPVAEMTKQMPLPGAGAFVHFIGLCEIAGALGLILPGLLRIRTHLTPIAAAGLVIIMSGATGISMAGGAIAPAVPPFVIGLLAGFVAYGRSRLAPIQERPRVAALRPAREFAPAMQGGAAMRTRYGQV